MPNKVLSNRKVIYLQYSLAIINSFRREQVSDNELVDVVLLLLGIRFFNMVCLN